MPAAGRDRRQRRRSSLSRVLGRGGSSSRIMPQHLQQRRLASAACASSGVVPVSSSYSSTPSE